MVFNVSWTCCLKYSLKWEQYKTSINNLLNIFKNSKNTLKSYFLKNNKHDVIMDIYLQYKYFLWLYIHIFDMFFLKLYFKFFLASFIVNVFFFFFFLDFSYIFKEKFILHPFIMILVSDVTSNIMFSKMKFSIEKWCEQNYIEGREDFRGLKGVMSKFVSQWSKGKGRPKDYFNTLIIFLKDLIFFFFLMV